MPTEEIEDMPKEYQEIKDMLASSCEGIPESWLQRRYEEKFKRSLDYNSLGVETVEGLLDKMLGKGMVLRYLHPESNERFVTNSRLPTDSSAVYLDIQYMLLSSLQYWIPESCFETTYKEMFKTSPDCKSLGVKDIKELLEKMRDKGMVHLYKDPKSNERYVTVSRFYNGSSQIPDLPKKSPDLYQQIQDILGGYGRWITMYKLEKRYYSEFWRSPDYASVGVKDIKELIEKMREKGRVLVYVDPESKETYVMCAWLVDGLLELLKQEVQELLGAHGGEIPLSRFDRAYKDKFKLKLNYHRYGLSGPDHLCEVLHLGLEDADSSGEKVIKACKSYNLRKRKRNG